MQSKPLLFIALLVSIGCGPNGCSAICEDETRQGYYTLIPIITDQHACFDNPPNDLLSMFFDHGSDAFTADFDDISRWASQIVLRGMCDDGSDFELIYNGVDNEDVQPSIFGNFVAFSVRVYDDRPITIEWFLSGPCNYESCPSTSGACSSHPDHYGGDVDASYRNHYFSEEISTYAQNGTYFEMPIFLGITNCTCELP